MNTHIKYENNDDDFDTVVESDSDSDNDDADVDLDINRENNREQKALAECQMQLLEWQQKYMHAMSDLQNFKNRVEKERAAWMHSAQTDLLKKLLKTVDDFDRAVALSAQTADDASSAHDSKQGLAMIHKSFHKFLDSVGVTIMPHTNTFDPEKHEAIMSVISDSHESGSVVDVIENGYMLGTMVLRPAKVSVAQ